MRKGGKRRLLKQKSEIKSREETDQKRPVDAVFVEDDLSSDSDIAMQVTDATIRGPRTAAVQPSSKSLLRSSMRQEEPRRLSERSRRERGDEDDEYADPWEERHKGAADYMTSSGLR